MPGILIVDDHKLFAEGIHLLVDGQDDCIILGTANTAAEAIAFLESHKCDVILCDMELPDMPGYELCSQIKSRWPEIEILALTTYNRPVFVRKMLQGGAKGYVIKNAEAEELLTAIKTVYSGELYISADVSKTMFQNISKPASSSNGLLPKLTKREKEILSLISNELTTKEIADKLYISESTVESHRANLLSKLDARNSVGLVKRAIELDLLKL